jgi:hypothetical protein
MARRKDQSGGGDGRFFTTTKKGEVRALWKSFRLSLKIFKYLGRLIFSVPMRIPAAQYPKLFFSPLSLSKHLFVYWQSAAGARVAYGD